MLAAVSLLAVISASLVLTADADTHIAGVSNMTVQERGDNSTADSVFFHNFLLYLFSIQPCLCDAEPEQAWKSI